MTTATLTETDFKVADLSLAEFGRKEIRLAEHEMPGLMALREEYGAAQPLQGRAHHRLAAHDDPDRRADRDARRARRRSALGSCNIFSTQDHAAAAVVVGPRARRRAAGRPGVRVEGRDARGVLVVHRAGADAGRAASGPNMILDDGGDVTLLVHKGVEFEKAGAVPRSRRRRLRGVAGHPRRCCSARSRRTRSTGRRSRRASRASPRRPPPASTASTRWRRPAAAVPGHQRQRLGHQVEVRQQVRLPPLADRRHQPRHRRA